jgi:hypothetical protein
VSRLCAPIDGTDIPRLANCLGLDTSKYQNIVTASADVEELYTFESTISEKERFKDVEKWTPRCNSCGERGEFIGFAKDEVSFINSSHAKEKLKMDSNARSVLQPIPLARFHASSSLSFAALCAST